MSNRRGSIRDYPEHLNPFNEGNEKFRFWKFGKVKRSGSFGETLRNTLTFKSFRGRKKDKQEAPPPSSSPELRRHDTINFHHRQTLPTSLSPIPSPARRTTTIALPRSRFSERVGKSLDSKDEIPNGHVSSSTPDIPSTNPFEEDEKVGELKPKRIRRRKRRAPLPPGMSREDGDAYLGVSSLHNLSKWSLTSVETDISTYSENEHDRLVLDDSINQEMSEIMNSITKEMEKLTDETNDTVTSKSDDHLSNDDVTDKDQPADSITDQDQSADPTTDKNQSADHVTDKDQPTDPRTEKPTEEEKICSDVPDIIASSTEIIQNEETNHTCNNDTPTSKDLDQAIDENSNLVSKELCENDEEKRTNLDNCDEKKEYIVSEMSEEMKLDEHTLDSEILYNTSLNHVASAEDLNFNERKTIYITDSNDNLNNSETAATEVSENIDVNLNQNGSPPTSPRCKTEMNIVLDNSKENIEEKQEIHQNGNEDNECKPIPKVRTHTPSKTDLLGNNTSEDL
ncbi:hypothetical protein ILUMI_04443 [Ignelater luminosus]|uniref:Uncharacterized protein n=1 Tax=Ignelater luminosus TaxID=2038154 RepID=A0A8K0DEB9_IGNLU|nr:hypothetical protein ILUMI_04443 [Ignelater luminosus]